MRSSLEISITPSREVGELTLVETLKRGPLGAGPNRLDGGNNYAWSSNNRLAVHLSSLVKRSYRLLGGITGHEGLDCLVGLHLAGQQFKGHGELGSRKRYLRQGASALLGEVPIHKSTSHIQYFVLRATTITPLSKLFGGKKHDAVTEAA